MAALKGWMKSNKITIPEEEHLFIRTLIKQVIFDHTNIVKEFLANSLIQKNLQMDDHRLSCHI
ncbi:MAG: hypothetical protein ACRCZY_11630 [Phocaeicola sp.]